MCALKSCIEWSLKIFFWYMEKKYFKLDLSPQNFRSMYSIPYTRCLAMAQAWLKTTFRTVYQSIACAHWTFLSVNFPLVSLHCNAFHVRPLGFMLVIFKPKKSAFCEEMAARHTTDHTLHNCSILLTHSPSQSAPTILVYQVNLIFSRVWNLKKVGPKYGPEKIRMPKNRFIAEYKG